MTNDTESIIAQGSMAAGAALLTYSIAPPQAYVGLQTTLTLTIQNTTGGPITMRSGRQGDKILITVPAPSGGSSEANSLTDNVNGINCQSQTTGFTAGQQATGGNVFQVSPTSTQVLQNGMSIQVTFAVTVNATIGTANLTIQELIGTNTGSSSVSVTKIGQVLSVITWFYPPNVGLNQPSTLYWQSFGATNVQVSGFNGPPQNFKVSGSPPYQNSVSVTMLPSWQQRTFSLVASSNDGSQAYGSATLTQQPQLITSLTTDPATPPNPFDPTQSAQLSWTTMYASAVYLTTPQKMYQVSANPPVPVTIQPGLDAIRGSFGSPPQIPSTATYQIQAQGYSPTTPTQPVTFQLGPMPVLWFKFLNNDGGKLSNVNFQLAGSWPNGAQLNTLGDNLSQLQVFQPGGATTTMYLGSGDTTNSPQIQYFNAATASPGSTLSWVTLNVTSLVLNPGNYQVPQTDIASGSYAVNPSASTTYVLTGTGPGGTVTSSLPVTVTVTSMARRRRGMLRS